MFVVTLPPSAALDPFGFAHKARNEGAEILEIRGDLTPDVAAFDSPLPILLSLRGADEQMIARLQPAYVDLELHEQELETPMWVNRIASFHDHKRTPPLGELKSIAATLQSHKPSIVKIATLARSYADLAVLESLRRELKGVPVVILAMGPLARFQRLLSPTRNVLTYTFVDRGEEAAPGQISLKEYKSFSHLKEPRLFGLLGGPASSVSLSPLIHNILFKAHGIDALYAVFPTEDLKDAFNNLSSMGVEGFSVTAPWKKDILDFADDTQEIAKRLQSSNTLVRDDKGWTAYNTDVAGIVVGYQFLKDCQSAAIIGSGGVAPAVIDACNQAGIEDVRIYARNEQTRSDLAKRFGVGHEPIEDLYTASHDVIICTISEDTDIPLPKAKAKKGSHAIDLRYGGPTKFLISAKSKGYKVHNGLPMLMFQALLQSTLFTGVTPKEDVLATLIDSLRNYE